jgi:hypothetical protein
MPFGFRKSLIRSVVLCAVATPGAISQSSAQAPAYDILIKNGRIVDGTGNPWYLDDVAVRNGKIVAVGRLKGTAARTVDASGLVVSPGFIDLHTHTELLGNPLAQSKVREGVTLDIMGEGGSVAPREPNAARSGRGGGGGRGGRASGQTWTDFNGYFTLLEKQGFAINIASYVGGGTIRSLVMGYDTGTPSPDQMAHMKQLMSQAMEQGAMGLSTQFESGGPDHPDEIIELAKIAGEYDGIFGSHIGSEGFQQEKEIGFVVRLAREARVPAHIFHFKNRRQLHRANRSCPIGGSGHHRERISLHRDVPRLERVLPGLGAARGTIRGTSEGSRHTPEDSRRSRFQAMVERTRRVGWDRDGAREYTGESEVRGEECGADRKAAR